MIITIWKYFLFNYIWYFFLLSNDHRDVIYGVVRDCFKEPVRDAVVKLVEVDYKFGKKDLKPVSHTFTDKEGEFVFGPLCPKKRYYRNKKKIK